MADDEDKSVNKSRLQLAGHLASCIRDLNAFTLHPVIRIGWQREERHPHSP